MKLIMAPGMAGQAKSFERLIAALGSRADCTAIQYPDDQALTHEQYKALIRDHCPADGTAYFLLGESFGSQRVFEICQERPVGLMGALFIVGFLGNPNPVLTQVSQVPALEHWASLPSDPRLVASFHGWQGEAAVARMAYLIEEAKRTHPKVTRSRIEIMRAQKVPPGDPLSLPAVLFDARRDRLVTHGAAARLRKQLSNATRYILDGPHFLIQSHPLELADAIVGFAARVTLTAADPAA